MYSKANIITLTGVLGSGLQNATTLSQFFDDVVESIGLSPFPIFHSSALVELSDGTGTYDFESDMLRLIHAIMEDASISIVTEPELDLYSSSWRTTEGTPIALTQDDLNRQYTLYPIPDFDSEALGGGEAEPYGEDYPEDQLVVIYTENKSANFQEYYALPLAFESLSREFAYPSDHQDTEFAESCAILSQFLHSILRGEDVETT
jgi:hypothetical protein